MRVVTNLFIYIFNYSSVLLCVCLHRRKALASALFFLRSGCKVYVRVHVHLLVDVLFVDVRL